MYFFLAAWFVINAALLDKKLIEYGLKASYGAAIIIATYAIVQKIGFDPLFSDFSINIFVGRVFSFLGNPGYLGQFLLLELLIGIYLLINTERAMQKILFIAGESIIFAAILFSQTRTALLALFVIAILFLTKQAVKISWTRQKVLKLFSAILIVSAITTGFILKLEGTFERFSFSSTGLRSLQSRFELWKATSALIKERPLGYGAETFYIYFPDKVTTEFLTLEENLNISADRIHNEILEIIFTGGIPSGIIYVVLIGAFFYAYFKSRDRLISLLTIVVLANAIQNQFAFPDITISILVIFCLAGFVVLQTENAKSLTMRLRKITAVILSAGSLMILYFVFLHTVVNPFLSHLDYTFSKATQTLYYAVSVNSLKNATAYTPQYSELWYELMIIDTSSMPRSLHYLEQLDGETGNVLAWKGNYYSLTDPQKSYHYFERALERNPVHPNWLRAYADAAYKNKEYKKALTLYEQYLKAVPDFWKWKDNLQNRSEKERVSYEVFFKNTPYFWQIVEKVEKLREQKEI